MPEFRITLLLNQFFSDCRATSRIFINNDMLTIGDLMKHISEHFNIDKNIYLTCNNSYLPYNEDIRVLKEDEVVCAIINREEFGDIVHNVTAPPKEIVYTKKTKKHKGHSAEGNSNENILNNIENNSEECLNADKLAKIPAVINEANTNKQKKNKKSKKSNQNDENVLQEFESITSKKTLTTCKESDVTNCNLSIHDGRSPYSYISNFKKPFRNPIKVMNISTIPKVIPTVYITDTIETTNNMITSPTPYNCITNSVTNNVENAETKKKDNTNDVHGLIEHDPINPNNIQSKNSTMENRSEIDLTKSKTKNAKFSNNKLEEAKQSLLEQIKEKFQTGYETKKPTTTDSCKSDIDDLESHYSDFSYSEFSDQSKKRKRKRVRRKNKPQMVDCPVVNTAPVVEFKPVKSSSTGTHLRFDIVQNSNEENIEAQSDLHTGNSNIQVEEENSACLKIEQENSNSLKVVTGWKGDLGSTDILKFPLLEDKLPKQGDIIAFKLLVMSQSYTPEVSQYIIANVLSYYPNSKKIFLKFLKGADQCRMPEGKFLMEEHVSENMDDEHELDLNQLLELRLLYP